MAALARKMYKTTIQLIDPHVPVKLRPLWAHPAGPKTVFFWAPLCKWGTVIAGLGDLSRSADKLSLNQSSVLVVSGLLWSRWSLIIHPKNYSLCMVNLLMASVQLFQLGRAIHYRLQCHTKIH